MGRKYLDCKKFFILVIAIVVTACGEKPLELSLMSTRSSVSGLPAGASHKGQFTASVDTLKFTSLIYKYGSRSAVDCDTASGYSPSQTVSTSILVDVSALADGDVVFCYIGTTETGRVLAARSVTWYRDTSPMQYVELLETESRVDETVGTVATTISIPTAKNYDLTISWERVDGDAIYGIHHFLSLGGTVSIAKGQTSVSVRIPILNNSLAEGEKYFGLRLTTTNSTRVHVGSDYQSLIYVKDNDGGQAAAIKKVQLGSVYNCSLDVAGVVRCWGPSEAGIFSNNFIYTVPQIVSGLSSGVTDISSHGNQTCALMADQTVKCWGQGTSGQLGNGFSVDSPIPVAVLGLSNAQQIAVGDSFSCALKNDGSVYCWGANGSGTLANTTTTNSNIPVLVQGLPGAASSIAAGVNHACAVVSSAVYCWGNGSSGEQGTGGTGNNLAATLVAGLTGVDSLHVHAYSTCALKNGQAFCWGGNWNGQLGLGDTTNRTSPVAVPGLNTGVTDIAISGNLGCAIKNGQIYCSGQTDTEKFIPDGFGKTEIISSMKLLDYLGSQNLKLHLTAYSGCFENVNHDFRCFESEWWGYGQVLPHRDSNTPNEFKIIPHSQVAKIIVAGEKSCVLSKSQDLWCWGLDSLPTATYAKASANGILISSLEGQVQDFSVSSWGNNVCAVTVSGAAYCWGQNTKGQLGDGTTIDRQSPVLVSGLGSGVQKVLTIGDASCAILQDGTVRCWGAGSSGQLGNGNTINSSVPVVVTGAANIIDITRSSNSSFCALSGTGAVSCWGYGAYGSLGNSATSNSSIPVAAIGLASGVEEIQGSEFNICARLNTGVVRCWGAGWYGVNGVGGGGHLSTPTAISLPVAASKLYPNHCVRLVDDSISCWGHTVDGEIYQSGSLATVLSPVNFAIAGYSISEVLSSHIANRCIKTTDDKYYCWGYNNFSILGDMRFDANKAIISNKWFR